MYFFGIVGEDINTLIEVTTPSPYVCALGEKGESGLLLNKSDFG